MLGISADFHTSLSWSRVYVNEKMMETDADVMDTIKCILCHAVMHYDGITRYKDHLSK